MKDKINPKNKVKVKALKVTDISDTFGELKRKVSGQKFKEMARSGW